MEIQKCKKLLYKVPDHNPNSLFFRFPNAGGGSLAVSFIVWFSHKLDKCIEKSKIKKIINGSQTDKCFLMPPNLD